MLKDVAGIKDYSRRDCWRKWAFGPIIDHCKNSTILALSLWNLVNIAYSWDYHNDQVSWIMIEITDVSLMVIFKPSQKFLSTVFTNKYREIYDFSPRSDELTNFSVFINDDIVLVHEWLKT